MAKATPPVSVSRRARPPASCEQTPPLRSSRRAAPRQAPPRGIHQLRVGSPAYRSRRRRRFSPRAVKASATMRLAPGCSEFRQDRSSSCRPRASAHGNSRLAAPPASVKNRIITTSGSTAATSGERSCVRDGRKNAPGIGSGTAGRAHRHRGHALRCTHDKNASRSPRDKQVKRSTSRAPARERQTHRPAPRKNRAVHRYTPQTANASRPGDDQRGKSILPQGKDAPRRQHHPLVTPNKNCPSGIEKRHAHHGKKAKRTSRRQGSGRRNNRPPSDQELRDLGNTGALALAASP